MSCFENLTLPFWTQFTQKPSWCHRPSLSVILLATLWPLRVSAKQKWQMSNCHSLSLSSSWVERGSPPTPSCRHGRKTRSIQADTNILTTLDTAKGAEITERKKKCDGVFHRTIPNQVKPRSVAVILSRCSSYNNPRLEFHCLPFYYIAQQTSVYTSLGPRQTCPLLGLGLIHQDCSIFGIWSDLCCFEAWH